MTGPAAFRPLVPASTVEPTGQRKGADSAALSRSWTEPADATADLMRRWRSGAVLSAYAAGEAFEPINLPIRGPSAGDLGSRFGEAQDWIARWERAAGKTLRLEYGDIGGRRVGANRIPRRVWVDSAEQLWLHLRVTTDVQGYLDLIRRTELRTPELVAWMRAKPHKVLEMRSIWDLLVGTVLWIDRQSDLSSRYLRQLDVPGVDTKFVERHRGVLSSLLDLRLAPSRIDLTAAPTDFLGRYGFRRTPAYVRFRILAPSGGSNFSEMTVRADELARFPIGQGRIFAVENEISYLAFPEVADSAVIFGGGYAVSALSPLTWLADREVVYWGDLDTHGFAILNLLRRQFPSTKSMLMDRRTLFAHESQWVSESSQNLGPLEYLTGIEQRLYADLTSHIFGTAVRLEQERVQFSVLQEALAELQPGGASPVLNRANR
jgi:hypothetical protein